MYYYTYYPNRICSPVEFVFIRMYYWKIGYIFNEHLAASKCTYSSQISYGCTNKAIEKNYKHFHFHFQFVYNERIFPYLFTSSSKEKRPPVYYLLENINLILKKKSVWKRAFKHRYINYAFRILTLWERNFFTRFSSLKIEKLEMLADTCQIFAVNET